MAKKVEKIGNLITITEAGQADIDLISGWCKPTFLDDAVVITEKADAPVKDVTEVTIKYTEFLDDTDTLVGDKVAVRTYLSDKVG